MSLPPPAGYGFHAVTLRNTLSARSAVCTFGFKNNGSASASSCNSLVSNFYVGAGKLLDAATMDSNWSIVQRYTLINTAGVLSSFTSLVVVAGVVSAAALPPSVSVILNKRTALAGRQYRGKVSLPPVMFSVAAVNDGGVIAGATVTALQGQCTAGYNDLISNNVPMYLLHGPDRFGVTPVPTAVTSVTVNALVGSQRRRIRR